MLIHDNNIIGASLSEPHIDELNVHNLYNIIIIITRNELASLAHSFLHLLETSAHSFDNCTAQIYIPWVHKLHSN